MKMKSFLKILGIDLKSICIKKSFFIMLFIIFSITFGVHLLFPYNGEKEKINIGICILNEDEAAKNFIAQMKAFKSVNVAVFDDCEKMKREIIKKNIENGYILKNEFQKIIESGEAEGLIEKIEYGSDWGMISDEIVASALFSVISPYKFEEVLRQNKFDEEQLKVAEKRRTAYLKDGSMMKVEFDVDSLEQNSQNSVRIWLGNILSVCVCFFFIFDSYCERKSRNFSILCSAPAKKLAIPYFFAVAFLSLTVLTAIFAVLRIFSLLKIIYLSIAVSLSACFAAFYRL